MSKLRIVILGYIVRGPIGGMAWHHLQYVLGFAKLGHDVLFLEDSDDYPSCYDPQRHTVDRSPSYGLSFAADAFSRLGLADDWAYYDAHKSQWHGPAADVTLPFCRSADVLFNISGVTPLRSWTEAISCRAYVDTDPAFTQVRNLTDVAFKDRTSQHTCHFSFGERIGADSSQVPDDGWSWRPTRQPIVLDQWTFQPPKPQGRYTTVMQWDSYPAVEYGGRRFGMKSETMRSIMALPKHLEERLQLALGGHSAPRGEIGSHGWELADPLAVTRTPWSYRDYIKASKAEISITKHGYVVSQCGWFSERSACYLATGRPVVCHDTGFSRVLPVGHGILIYDDMTSARHAIQTIESDYQRHCDAARQLAVEHFDSNKVLRSMLDAI